MHIWHSEDEGGGIHHVKKDPFTVMLTEDPDNSVLILNSYETTGTRYNSLLFFGPDSGRIAKKWHTWSEEEAPETGGLMAVLKIFKESDKLFEAIL